MRGHREEKIMKRGEENYDRAGGRSQGTENGAEKGVRRLEFRGGIYAAFIPLVIFCAGVIAVFVTWMALDFQAVAMMAILGLMAGSLFCRQFGNYWEAAGRGMANEVCVYTLLILFVVGMFGALIKACNVSHGFVWLADNINLRGGTFAVFVFIATCIVSTATGSSFSALYSCFPIFYPAAVLLGCRPNIMAGLILAGAIFGDNLAPISDTTILSASAQEYKAHPGRSADIGQCVATRFKYSITAGIAASLVYLAIAGGYAVDEAAAKILMDNMDPKPLIMLIPVALMLGISIKTRNIFKAIITGLAVGTVVGLASGLIGPKDILWCEGGVMEGFLYSGFSGMVGVALIILCLNGIIGILNESGALDALIDRLMRSRMARTVRGAELMLALTQTVIATAMGGAQDPAIITMGPVFNRMGQEKGLHPTRRANLLDGFSNSLAVTVPFLSCYVFLACQLTGGYTFIEPLTTFEVSSGMVYTVFLFAALMISVFTGWGRAYEGPDGEMVKENGEKVKHPYSIF